MKPISIEERLTEHLVADSCLVVYAYAVGQVPELDSLSTNRPSKMQDNASMINDLNFASGDDGFAVQNQTCSELVRDTGKVNYPCNFAISGVTTQ